MKWKFSLKTRGSLATILLEVRRGRRYRLSTGIKIKKTAWDSRRQRVRDWFTGAKEINALLTEIERDLIGAYARNPHLTIEDIKRIVLRQNSHSLDLLGYMDEFIERRKGLVSYQTWKNYRRDRNRIAEFLNGKARLLLEDVNAEFIENLVKHLRNKGYADNTIAGILKFLRTVMFDAHKRGLCNRPSISVKWIETEKHVLTLEEAKQLIKYYEETHNPTHKKHLRWILFILLTGLRWGDMNRLKWKHIQGNRIVLRMGKTKRLVSIPLSNRAKSLLPPRGGEEDTVWQLPTNQVANRLLRQILSEAGINKHMTIHALRHSFATISLELGMPIEVVQKILGHTKISTTLIYTHIVDKRKEEEMKKWDQL